MHSGVIFEPGEPENLASYDIEDVIPTKENERRRPGFDKAKYRLRNIVERAIGSYIPHLIGA